MNYEVYIEDEYIVLDFKPPKVFIPPNQWCKEEGTHQYQSLVLNKETNEWEVVWTKHSLYLRTIPKDMRFN